MAQPPAPSSVEALHARLAARLVDLRPLHVAHVMRAVLDISALPCTHRLGSLEFGFDEDEGRIARIEARFAERGVRDPFQPMDLGYEVEIQLPRIIPTRMADDGEQGDHAVMRVHSASSSDGSLVARFVRALADLGAYRNIEPVVALSVETNLL